MFYVGTKSPHLGELKFVVLAYLLAQKADFCLLLEFFNLYAESTRKTTLRLYYSELCIL